MVVVDDPDREDEGDLVMAAEAVTEEHMAFLVRHTTGINCAPLSAERAERLRLPQMVADNTDSHGTAFTECFQAAKSEAGLASYQVRDYTAWYRHVTLAMLAHAYLSATRATAGKGGPEPGTTSSSS